METTKKRETVIDESFSQQSNDDNGQEENVPKMPPQGF